LVACGLAAESGDPGLLAQVIGASSIVYSTLPWSGRGGNSERAIELLDQAGTLAVHADPHTRLWIAAWHADACAGSTTGSAPAELRQTGGSVPIVGQILQFAFTTPRWTPRAALGGYGR